MSAKLLKLPKPAPVISTEMVDHMTWVCVQIMEGNVSGLGIAVVHRDGTSSTAYDGPSMTTLIGAVERLKYRLVTDLDVE